MKRIFIIILLMGMFVIPTEAQQLNTAEYFFNSDPGVGNGNTLSVTPSDTVIFNGSISTSGLQDGFHLLYIRSRDDNGIWSLTERRVFFIQTQTPQMDLSSAEYFFDTDPGIGNGVDISVTSSDTVVYSGLIPVTALTPGFHLLYLRSVSMDSKWSLTERRVFYIADTYTPPILVDAEYFVDTDPGFGNATSISVAPGDTLDFTGALTITNTDTGTHKLYIRALDASNVWSLYEPFEFQISNSAGIDDPLNPDQSTLFQNYPNPFDGVTQIDFYLRINGDAKFYITDLIGKILYEKTFQNIPQGKHSFNIDMSAFGSGNYMCRMVSGSFTQTKKMVLLKE